MNSVIKNRRYLEPALLNLTLHADQVKTLNDSRYLVTDLTLSPDIRLVAEATLYRQSHYYDKLQDLGYELVWHTKDGHLFVPICTGYSRCCAPDLYRARFQHVVRKENCQETTLEWMPYVF